jgi:hypothetical protein
MPLRNIPDDQQILDAVNLAARLLVNAEIPAGERPLPEGFRCDLSRVRFIRRRWERAVEQYQNDFGINPLEALARIEAGIRRNAKVLHVERR